jgi:ubiquinone/menaquinone biosynthesis C-methylase UbiE
MTGSAKDVQAFFERVATDWDTMRLAYYDERVIEKMAEVSSIDEGSEVAGVGTGTGFVAAGLASRVKRVIGIDNSSSMLRVARGNLDSLGVSNAELLIGDLAALPLADNLVDAAFANMVLHHTVDPVAMLEEMARIVRPGGTIVITEEVEHPYEWMREEHADIWLGVTPEAGRKLLQRGGASRLWV